MTTTFETAKVGDRVWCLLHGWHPIIDTQHNIYYPILTRKGSYTIDGRNYSNNGRILFWDEVIITPPPKPAPNLEVDTKVLVWDFEEDKYKIRGHFSHFNKYGSIFIFANGTTSWSSSSTVGYRNWKLAKD